MSTSSAVFDRRHFLGKVGVGATVLATARSLVFAASPAKQTMSHRERIEKVLALEETDRLPFGFWWHFPNQDRAPRRLAQLSLELQQKLDLDFIKFSPYGLYSVVDWGVTLEVLGGKLPPVQAGYPIKKPEDWRRLRRFRGMEGEYLIVLEAQRIALSEMRQRVPLIQTVFSPLTTALKLAGPETLLTHLRDAPAAVHAGLAIIAETTRRFVIEALTRGADGLFFASQTANDGYLTRAEYAEFAKKYDLAVLEAVEGRSWFNILHLHGEKIMFDAVLDYPVQALNYHDREAGPSLAEMRKRTKKCLVGGIGHNTTLVHGTQAEVDAQVRDAWRQVNRRGLILGPGCVASLESPEANVLQLRKSVERTAE
ncbi:MAG: uroporphyrinogen decarboxylase family protein [Thermoguttaceae bacterium]